MCTNTDVNESRKVYLIIITVGGSTLSLYKQGLDTCEPFQNEGLTESNKHTNN